MTTSDHRDPNTSTRQLNILLLGTHGQNNIGDELLLTTFLSQLGDAHHYRINSYAPEVTAAALRDRYDVETFHTTNDRAALLRHLFACDVVVFGGGSIVKELGPTPGRHRYATLLMLLTLVTAIRFVARRPILMSNIGVGPIHKRGGRLLAKAVLHQATLVSVRDSASRELCAELGCDSDRVRLVPDAVWANEQASIGPAPSVSLSLSLSLSLSPYRSDRTRLGINLNRDIAVPARWDDFQDELVEALRLVASRRPVEIVGLPMQTGFKTDDDREMLEALLRRVPEIPSTIADVSDHRDIAVAAGGCDVVIAERLHALVIAAILGRPTVALAYDPKVDELVVQLGLEDRAVDVNTDFTPATLADMVDATLDDTTEALRLRRLADTLRQEATPYFADVRAWLHRRGATQQWSDLAA